MNRNCLPSTDSPFRRDVLVTPVLSPNVSSVDGAFCITHSENVSLILFLLPSYRRLPRPRKHHLARLIHARGCQNGLRQRQQHYARSAVRPHQRARPPRGGTAVAPVAGVHGRDAPGSHLTARHSVSGWTRLWNYLPQRRRVRSTRPEQNCYCPLGQKQPEYFNCGCIPHIAEARRGDNFRCPAAVGGRIGGW